MLSPHASPLLVAAVRGVAQWLLVVPAALTVWVVVARRRWKADILEAVLAGLLTIAFVKAAGAAFVHARPFVVYGRTALVPHAADNAFPSDHLAACGLAFGYVWPRSGPTALVILACAVLIGAARVLAGLHWPADIIGGFFLGALAAFAAGVALRSYAKRRQ